MMESQGFIRDPAPLTIGSIFFPTEIAGFSRGDVIDNRIHNKGLGHSIPYNRPDVKATIYLYNNNMGSIPDGPTSDVVHQQFKQAISDVFRSAPQIGYDDVQLAESYYVGDPETAHSFAIGEFEIQQGGQELISHLCLTGHEGKFIKVRITAAAEAKQYQIHTLFLSELLKVLALPRISA
jgi:hypothetical protein